MTEAIAAPQTASSVRLGLKENWPQFALLVLINAFVGGMVGIERTVVPLIGSEEFRISSTTLVVSFIVSFGVVKACANLASGQLADKWGRKRVHLPVPFMIIWAPSWVCPIGNSGSYAAIGSDQLPRDIPAHLVQGSQSVCGITGRARQQPQ
jgi:MFS family permease